MSAYEPTSSSVFVAYLHQDSRIKFVGIFETWEEAARHLYEMQKDSFDPEDEEGNNVSTWLTELKLYGKTSGTRDYQAIAKVAVSPVRDDAFEKGLAVANAAFAKKEASDRDRRVKAKRKISSNE